MRANEDGFLTVDDRVTTIEATNFLYNLQQRKDYITVTTSVFPPAFLLTPTQRTNLLEAEQE